VTLARRAVQRLRRRLTSHLDRWQQRRRLEQWLLLIGRQPLPGTGPLDRPLDPGALTPILPPRDRFWADPFLWSQGERFWVFVEELPFDTGRGRISVLELDGGLQPEGPARPVLDEPRHLSYPYLFEYGGELFMVPESSGSASIDCYRCIEFPARWTLELRLMTGIQAADATLFEHHGRWWLFCSARAPAAHINGSLFAFHADTPLSERWSAQPGNPLVRDFSRGRPAGRVLRTGDGRLIRPAQDCVPRYGHGLRLMEIEQLTPDGYREREIWRGTGPRCGGWRAMHHLDWHTGVLVMDAQRLLAMDAVDATAATREPGGRGSLSRVRDPASGRSRRRRP
jgi:hypothetical protein